jgi:hypothetical protein
MTQAWRSKKYHCIHLKKEAIGLVCSLDLCSDDDVLGCCATCTEYRGRDRGLGDTIKRATDALGIKPCGGCQKRREALNKMTGKLYNQEDTHGS